MNQEELSTDYLQQPVLEPWVERNGFAHWVVAIVWFGAAFLLFQLIGGIVGALLLLPELMVAMETGGDIQAVFTSNLDKMFIGNSAGQFLIIGFASYLVSKLHTRKGEQLSFLRLKTSPNVWVITALTAVLVIVVMPFNGFLGWLNYLAFDELVQVFPTLNWFIETQESMSEMIKGFIGSENAIILAFIHIGIVPAIFEEVMFRGYIMRALEKSGGIIVAVVVSGLLFGAYHLQPSNVIPLATLGILFAYVTYISDSLIPAMVAHLLNNGGQVIYGATHPEFLDQEMTKDFDMPILLVVGSMILTSGLIYLMFKLKNKEVGNV
tara:strand:+ start:11045 stop:12013 length:969 start_codon:yes stop_codon:yes gene_type:complete